MKRLIRFCGACLLLLPLATAFPQGVMHYVKAQSGDTLLIKDYYDMSDSANSLYLAMFSDTVSLPKTRVYQLETGGYYPLTNGPNTTTKQPTTILGQISTPLVENTIAYPTPEKPQRTLVLIKPDNFKFATGRPGNIIDFFSRAGLYIVGAKVLRMSTAQAMEFYGPVREFLRAKHAFGTKRLA